MPRTGQAREVGKAIERDVHFAGRAAILVTLHVFEEVGGQIALFHEFQECEIGIDAGRNHVRIDFLAAVEDDAVGDTVLDEDFLNSGVHADFDAGFARGIADGV